MAEKRHGPDHPQTHIEHGDLEADVDEEIAPLILALWQLDCQTVMSCQDNFGRVWINFATGDDAERFLSLAAGRYEEDEASLYMRIVASYGQPAVEVEAGCKARFEALPEEVEIDYGRPDDWWFSVTADDLGVEYESDGETVASAGPADLFLSVSVRFPRSDLAEVMRRVEEALKSGQRSSNEPSHRF